MNKVKQLASSHYPFGQRHVIPKIAVMTLCLLISPFAGADEDHYINTFLGDRAAGMGGAYTAVADGPEGSIYNPAGLAFAGSSYISLSTNALQFKRTTYKELVPGVDWQKDSFSFIPNFFGVVQKFGNTTFGFTIATPDNESIEQRDTVPLPLYDTSGNPILADIDGDGEVDDQVTQDKILNIDHIDILTEAGFSFAWLLGKHFALGVGLTGGYRNTKFIGQNVDQISLIRWEWTETIYSRDQLFTLRPKLGIQIMPVSFLSIAYAVSAPIPIFGSYDFQRSYLDYNTATGTYDSSIQENTEWRKNLFTDGLIEPTYIQNAMGIAWFASKSILVSLDFYAYIPFTPTEPEAGDYEDTASYQSDLFWYNYFITRRRPFVWNLAVGFEWYISPNFPLRLGFFTNNANTPDIDTSKTGQSDHADMLGGTFSIGFSTSDFSLNIGTAISHSIGDATGQALSEKAGEIVTQEMSIFAATVFISGGYQF